MHLVLCLSCYQPMCLANQFWLHTAMSLSLCSATLASQRITQAIAWVLRQSGYSIDVYIDDFYLAQHPALVQSALDCLLG